MALDAKIRDGQGTTRTAGVTRDHALKVEVQPTRYADVPAGALTSDKLYREYFTNNLNASALMNVNGTASAPVRFTIDSKSDRVLCITRMKLVFESSDMAASGSQLRRFGAASIGSLTNGLVLIAVQGGVTTNIFLDPVKNIGDFFNYTNVYTAFTDGVAAGVDLLTFTIDFEVPIYLPAGSVDYLEFQVRDNLTLISYFRAMVLGSQELISSKSRE